LPSGFDQHIQAANSDIKFVDLSLPHWKDSLLKDVNWDHIDEDSMFPASDFEDVPYSFQYDPQSKTVYYGNGWTHHADIKAQGGKGGMIGTFEFKHGIGSLDLYQNLLNNYTAQVFNEIKEAFEKHFKVEIPINDDDDFESPNWNFSSVKQSSIQIHEYPASDTTMDSAAKDSRPLVVERESEDIHIGSRNSYHYALLDALGLKWADISVDGRINYFASDTGLETGVIDIYEKNSDYGSTVIKWMQAEEPDITFVSTGKTDGNWSFSAVRPERINDNKDPFDPVTLEELKPWQPGEYGKFIGTGDQIHTWTNQANPYHGGDTTFDGWPAHQAVADALGLGPMYTENWDSNYAAGHISPDGALSVLDDLYNTVDKMVQQDPRLYQEEGWTFSKVASCRFGSFDLDEFDPLSDDDYMGEDFDDQAIKDLLRQGVRRGREGKGLKLPDGDLVYWEGDVHGAPHHMEVLHALGVRGRNLRQVEFLMVSRESEIKNEADFDNQGWEFE
jgi:hypothetical protein